MEQNNFEKNVQQKMDELKIAPSDSVWTNVEKRIDKKEKDRKVIFILFLLIVFLLSGGYWLLKSTKNNQKNNQQISQVVKNESSSKTTNKPDSSFGKSQITAGDYYANIDSADVSAKKIKNANSNSANKVGQDEEQKQERLFKELISKQKESYSKPGNNADSVFLVNKSVLIPPNLSKKETQNYADNSGGNVGNKINADSISAHLTTEKTEEKTIAVVDSSAKNDSQKKQKRHWKMGFTLSGGASLIGKNLLERDFPIADYNSGMPPGGIPSYYYPPSPIKNSTAFVAGVFLEKNISDRGKIALGLSYKYYSLVNKVGKKVDSLLSPSTQYLSVSNSLDSFNSIHTYRNAFHYLEVPVSFKLQLNKSKKLPLLWEAGVNLSQLIGSNALQFKSNPGVYYHDNSILNKTQFGLHIGFTATLFSQQRMPITFGPYFYYSATNIADKGLYGGKHFSFAGIKAEILFRKK
ncbi:MAG: outer membrane beta-barrel protein [Ginsengibacter sp.]